jgi:hypothetical protein
MTDNVSMMLHLVTGLLAEGGTTSETGSPSIDSFLPYLNFGLLGLLVVVLASKKIFVPKWTLDDTITQHTAAMTALQESHKRELEAKDLIIKGLERDKDELKATNTSLQALTRDQFLPALIEANRLTALYVDTLARQQRPPSAGGV